MVVFFERIQQRDKPAGQDGGDEDQASLPIAISSHPDHGERIRFFRYWRPD